MGPSRLRQVGDRFNTPRGLRPPAHSELESPHTMLRRFHATLSLASALLLLAVATLWVRSHWRSDNFTLRCARSYTANPGAKWLILRSRDALVFSAHLQVVPAVEPGNPPWREDVPAGFVVPVSDSPDPAVIK